MGGEGKGAEVYLAGGMGQAGGEVGAGGAEQDLEEKGRGFC